jgi:hypothetical protein
MADLKISQLTAASTPLAGTEVLPIVQSSSTKKVSVADLTAGRAVAMAGGSFTDNITQGTAAKGINFTANTPAAGMTSQLLNWYEEGLYTATLTCSVSGTITVDSNFNTLAYTRVGRLVTVSGGIRVSAVSSPTGAVVLNLPFTSANLNKEAGLSVGTMVAVNLGAYSQPLSMYVIENAADAYIQYMNSGTRTSVPGSDFSGDEELVICITYLAA